MSKTFQVSDHVVQHLEEIAEAGGITVEDALTHTVASLHKQWCNDCWAVWQKAVRRTGIEQPDPVGGGKVP